METTFDVIVWFSYVVAGEREKDFDDLVIEANSHQEACNKASKLYTSLARIPFRYEVDGMEFIPSNND